MRVGVIRFPGSNCEVETCRGDRARRRRAVLLSHRETDLSGVDAAILPGGFSYGDYLRSGAIARFSPAMDADPGALADRGAPVLGICNGFQILCEAGLLPGALVRNASLRYLSRPVTVRVERIDTPFTAEYDEGELLAVPIGHGDGRYVASETELNALEVGNQVVLRYAGPDLPETPANPNGSLRNIAAICNAAGNVVGMMPHPERLFDPIQGPAGGSRIFQSLIRSLSHAGRSDR